MSKHPHFISVAQCKNGYLGVSKSGELYTIIWRPLLGTYVYKKIEPLEEEK